MSPRSTTNRPTARRPRHVPPGPAQWDGRSYYGRSPVKSAPWDDKVAAYVFLGGMGGGAQMVGAVGELIGGPENERLAADARALAVVAAVGGTPFLIADLKTPRRWYNMLRILRPTSPLSLGSWVLFGFGVASVAALSAGLANGKSERSAKPLRLAAQLPAAVAGLGMATYTGSLFAATSTPSWAALSWLLPARFGCAGIGSGAAALGLVERLRGRGSAATRLDPVVATTCAAELLLDLWSRRRLGLETGHRRDNPRGHAARLLYGLGAALGVANTLAPRPSGTVSVAASVATIAASYLMRSSVLEQGLGSAASAEDSFRFTQPERAKRSGRVA